MSDTKISRLSDDDITRLAERSVDLIETAILALKAENSIEGSYAAGTLQIASDQIYEIQTRFEEKKE